MAYEQYWPSLKEINSCITATDAEGYEDDSLIIASHVSSKLIKYDINGEKVEEFTEDSFYHEYVSGKGQNDAYLIFPIIGPSGIGKSHLLRLMSAKLKTAKKKELKIIRIRKNFTFKSVIESILTELRQIEDFNEGIVNSVTEFVPTEDTPAHDEDTTIKHKMEQFLLFIRQQMEVEKFNNPIVFLLKEDSIKNRFMETKTPLNYIMRRFFLGKLEDSGVYNFNREFIDSICNIDYDPNNQNFANNITHFNNENLRKDALDYINKNLDTVLGKMIRYQSEFEFTEIFRKIRIEMHRLQYELVLFVEDLAAVLGKHHEFMNALIDDSNVVPGETLCKLRVLIAITDGKWDELLDTHKTRINHFWKIAPPTDKVVFTKLLIGKYLNISRWGVEAVIEKQGQLEAFKQDPTPDCFGKVNDYYLFPLNDRYIEKMVNDSQLTPRKIKLYLSEVLEKREDYINGLFPSIKVSQNPLLANQLKQITGVQHKYIERYVRLIEKWGTGTVDHGISEGVFEEFRLPPLGINMKKDADITPPQPVMPTPQTGAQNDYENAKKNLLEWSNNRQQAMLPESAQIIKKFIVNYLKLLTEYQIQILNLRWEKVYIHGANARDLIENNSELIVINDESFDNKEYKEWVTVNFHTILKLHYDIKDYSLYDMIELQLFCKDLLDKVRVNDVDEYRQGLVILLYFNTILIDNGGIREYSSYDNIRTMFQNVEKHNLELKSEGDVLQVVRQSFEVRESLIKKNLEYVAARQGTTAEKVLAFDVVEIKNILDILTGNVDYLVADQILDNYKRTLNEFIKKLDYNIAKNEGVLERIFQTIEPNNFNGQRVNITETIKNVQGIVGNIDAPDCSVLKESEISTLFRQYENIKKIKKATIEEKIAWIVSIEMKYVRELENFVKDIDRYFVEVARRLKSDNPDIGKVEQFKNDIDAKIAVINTLGEL